MVKDIIISFISTLGFGIIFNIRGKNLFFASIGGVIGWLVYLLSYKNGIANVQSLFISSIIFSSYSEIMARILKTPVTTFVICAFIPLVPGSGMYYAMYNIATGNFNDALSQGISTLSGAGALALGVIFVSTFTRLINAAKKKSLTIGKDK